jgi:hypothetical protein
LPTLAKCVRAIAAILNKTLKSRRLLRHCCEFFTAVKNTLMILKKSKKYTCLGLYIAYAKMCPVVKKKEYHLTVLFLFLNDEL